MKTVKLGDICNLMTGGTPSRSKKEYFENGTIPWLVSGDIHKGEITSCEGRITELGLRNSNARLLPVNSVMIALNGQGKTRATVALLRIEATCNQSLVSIYPKDDSKVLPEYIYWNLKGRYDELRRLTGDDGNDRRGLNMIIIRNIDIPEPPSIEEQWRVVERLDAAFEKIDRAIAFTNSNKNRAKQLLTSSVETVFDPRNITNWSKFKVKELGSVQTGTTPKSTDKEYYGDFIPFIKPGDFKLNGNLNYDNVGLSIKGAKVGRLIPANSVLMVCIGATITKAGYSTRDISCNQQINAVSLADEKTAKFVYYQMITNKFKQKILNEAPKTTLPIINKSKWGMLDIFLPSEGEVSGIVMKLDYISAISSSLIANYNSKIIKLNKLKHSILSKAFFRDGVQ